MTTLTTTLDACELDRQTRAVLAQLTPETVLACVRRLADLGYPGRTAFFLALAKLERRVDGDA